MNNQIGLVVAGATPLTDALNKIQRQLKAPKNQKNSFGNYNYRSCEDILEAVKPLLGDGIVLLSDEIALVGDRYYVKATATFSLGSESASVSAYARESLDKKGMDSAQITGAASSYARKYALNGLFCIDDTKDADTNGHDGSVVEYIDEKQQSQLLDMINDLDEAQLKPFLAYMKVDKVSAISKDKFQVAVSAIQNKKQQVKK